MGNLNEALNSINDAIQTNPTCHEPYGLKGK